MSDYPRPHWLLLAWGGTSRAQRTQKVAETGVDFM